MLPISSNAAPTPPESLISLSSGDKRTLTNHAGTMGGASAVGQSWTDKITAKASATSTKKAPGDDLQGVADDEWD